MDENKWTTPNDGEQLNNNPSQDNNPNTVNLANIYPDPNQNRPIINETISQDHLESNDDKNTGSSIQANKSKKPLIIALIGVAILIGVIAIIFVPKPSNSNNKETKEALSSIDYVLPTTIDACKDVRNYVDDHNLKPDLYEKRVNSCKELVAKVYELVDKLNSVNDAGIKEAFNDFKTSLDTNMPSPSQLEDTLEAYTSMHNFNVALYNYKVNNKTETAENLVSAVDNLANSSNDSLSEFGKGAKQAYSELYDTSQQFNNVINEMGENDQTNYDKYIAAEKNFYDYVDNNKPNISSLYLLANDDNGEISNAFNNLIQKAQ